MYRETYDRLAAREDRYWWHAARRTLAAGLLRRHGLGAGCVAVDLGCGTGGNLSVFDGFTPRLVAGVDLSPIALEHTRRKRPAAPLLAADLSRPLPFADNSVDVVTLFNVLYHRWIQDETAVLSEVRRILRPGGFLLATEPAFRALERQMDHAAMGRRRFRIPEFRAICRSAGLQVCTAAYFTSFGAPVALLMKRVSSGAGQPAASADMKPLNPIANALLYAAARVETAMILMGFRPPFGVTLICLARKA